MCIRAFGGYKDGRGNQNAIGERDCAFVDVPLPPSVQYVLRLIFVFENAKIIQEYVYRTDAGLVQRTSR